MCSFFICLNLITDWRNSGLWSQSAASCEDKSSQGEVALDFLTTKMLRNFILPSQEINQETGLLSAIHS